ncbi:MAG: thioredoxin family protein [Bacteroidetes bacterium]|nr:thioredoxin family protein [Bacteroidota bacterium]
MKKLNKTLHKNSRTLVEESLKKAISYEEYRRLVTNHVEKGTSSGPNQSEALSNYTLLNNSRMKRLDKTIKIKNDIAKKFQNYKGDLTWLVLTESWCGDAAHSMPVMNKLAQLTPNIEFKVVQRHENVELMNEFLTNGKMAIPKLIVYDNNKNEVINNWGSKPSKVVEMIEDIKKIQGTLTSEFKMELQVWYNKDKGENISEDLSKLLN